MFIEKNKENIFLAKKVFGKKISVSAQEEIHFENIEDLSKKEFLICTGRNEYKTFKCILYDTNTLDRMYYRLILDVNLCESDTTEGAWLRDSYDQFPITFIHESNKTEGSQISYEDVKKIIQGKKSSHKNKNEIKEVNNSSLAW